MVHQSIAGNKPVLWWNTGLCKCNTILTSPFKDITAQLHKISNDISEVLLLFEDILEYGDYFEEN